MKISMKYTFLFAFSSFFFAGCTGTTTVGVGVYGGYGYPHIFQHFSRVPDVFSRSCTLGSNL